MNDTILSEHAVDTVRGVLEEWYENECEVLNDAFNYMIERDEGVRRCERMKAVAEVLKQRLSSAIVIDENEYNPDEYHWYDE